jgi:hypothetical protein
VTKTVKEESLLDSAASSETISLPRDWYICVVADGVDKKKPGIYEWRIEGVGTYIGKFTRIRRPTKEYGRNVMNLLNEKPYRRGNKDGFRRIHRALERAHREGREIRLTILENVDKPVLNRSEHELIKERGSLNDPPFGEKIETKI